MSLLNKKIKVNFRFYILAGLFFLFIIPSTNVTIPLLEKNENFEKDGDNIYTLIKPAIKAVSPHDPISIDGNADFATQAGIEGWQGNGSQSNPYIIENYFINNDSNNGISIRNSNVFFIIRNVWANGSVPYGFYLDNTDNGALYNNSATNTQNGFQLLYSDYNTLVGNNASDGEGFRVQWSNNNILTYNTATNCPIVGFYLESSSQNFLTNNTADNSNNFGFYLASTHQNTFINNTAISNVVYGFHLYSSTQNSFTSNNIINQNSHGFYFRGSSNLNSLSLNTVSDNNGAGAYIDDSSENTLSQNIFENNGYGVRLTSSTAFNIVIDNIFISNSFGDVINDGSNNLVPHGPISLDGNADFASQALSEGWEGNGSQSYPYIVKDYYIDSAPNSGINISNTDVYFIIENVWVNNSVFSGFELNNLSNAQLINNTATYNAYFGILVQESSTNNSLSYNDVTSNNYDGIRINVNCNNNSLINNSAYNNRYGYYINLANYNSLTNNTATSNRNSGFVLQGSSNNTLIHNSANNNFERGIWIYQSSNNNSLINNTATSNTLSGFFMSVSSNSNDLTNNFATSNNIAGFHLENSCNNNTMSNNTADYNTYGIVVNTGSNNNYIIKNTGNSNSIDGLSSNGGYNNTYINNYALNNGRFGFSLWTSSNNVLTNNNGNSNVQHGFYLAWSTNNVFTNNNGNYNTQHGFLLGTSSNNSFTGNNVTDNLLNGFYLVDSSYNILTGNIVTNNSRYGIWLNETTSFNTVTENTFIANNVEDIKDDGLSNTISNNIFSQDPYISSPSDFSIYYGDTGYSILWTVTDNNPANYTVYDNGTIYDTGTWTTSVIIWLDGLEEALHYFTCIVQNSYGNNASDTVIITVLPAAPDTTSPTISSPTDFGFEEGSIGYSIEWIGSDAHPWWGSVWRNNTLIYDQSWTPLNEKIEILLDGLNVGSYNFTCSLFDEAGNSITDTVWITVTVAVPDIEAPIITPPGPVTYEEGSTGHILTWNCSDAHPYAYQITINALEFPDHEYNPWHGENISISIDGLDVGLWILNLTLWDLSGNSTSNEV
ncbi:MAG: right-handed parallel beta-helix repeat-containing protein, partial [Candidatus Hodarchaeales archaeon]